jgi:hypothetical protein
MALLSDPRQSWVVGQFDCGRITGLTEGRGPLMHARIGMLRALNRNVERTFNSSRKDTHWGKRKLKRDE